MKSIQKFYRGFSTRNYESSGGHFDIYNEKCVEEDLLNEIFTVRGDRLYMPSFGTRIPLLTFEPNDAETMDVIRQDITTVCTNDPRVKLEALSVIALTDKNAMLAVARITYLEFNVTQDLNITVSSR